MSCDWPSSGVGFMLLASCASTAAPLPTPVPPLPAVTASASNGASKGAAAPQAGVAGTAGATEAAGATAGGPGTSDAQKFVPIDTTLFFANLQVSRDEQLAPTELRLKVNLGDGPFGELTKRGLAGSVRDRRLLVRLVPGYPISRDAVRKQHRACSHVIDCDSPAVQTLGVGKLPPQPSMSDLVQFTSSSITAKSLARGFDIASEVATSHEGDCSEHAVLLAALARLHHLPARVVLGFAVLSFRSRLPMLVGHAWTEIHDGKAWQLADAALVDAGLDRVTDLSGLSYLPVQLMEREDAGFRARLMTEAGVWQVEQAEANY